MDIAVLTRRMMAYFAGDPKRIQHFLKVHSLARLIGLQEGLEPTAQAILEAAAIVHDGGIKPAEEKYGSCSGSLQEQEGPAVARELLRELACPPEMIERVCFLVGHHHTYDGMEGADYQILVEADFLVNLYEDAASPAAIRTAYDRIFRTQTGRALCRTMFGMEE